MSQLWVLVVDDDPDIRESICEVLTAEGFAVSTAADGSEALRLMQSRTPDAVVLDLRMPRMSGWDLLKAVRERSPLAAVPFIVVSADLVGPSFGASAWLHKPVNPEERSRPGTWVTK